MHQFIEKNKYTTNKRKHYFCKMDRLEVVMNELYLKFSNESFIEDDPILIPHLFTKKEDVEISGFFASIFAWGQRKTIINKSKLVLSIMDNAPYDFICNHTEQDLRSAQSFVHRTFNSTDLLYFFHRLKRIYSEEKSLETAFSKHLSNDDQTIENALSGFYHNFFDDEFAPNRTRKHIASPLKNSTCKRLCMFLRWMVRKDAFDIDFGLWSSISPNQLQIPLDVHVERISKQLGLLTRKQRDWKAVIELTSNLRTLDANDPVKYDFALFGAGVNGLSIH